MSYKEKEKLSFIHAILNTSASALAGGFFTNLYKNWIARKSAVKFDCSEKWQTIPFLLIKNSSDLPIYIVSVSQCGFFKKPKLFLFSNRRETKDDEKLRERGAPIFIGPFKALGKDFLDSKAKISPGNEMKIDLKVNEDVKVKITWKNSENNKSYSRSFFLKSKKS